MTDFLGDKAFFFEKKNPKWLTQKKNFFCKKCHGFVLGLVGLIDAKDIDVAQPIWLRDCLT